jgi:hypothetical protein
MPVDSRSVLVRVLRIQAAGSLARIELSTQDGKELFTAEIGKSELQSLALIHGEDVFITPRSIRYFDKAETQELLDQGAGI